MSADVLTLTTEIARLFPPQGQWTEADFLSLPETNHIVELSNGKVVMPDMPTTTHQRAVTKLLRLMSAHAEANDLGEVSVAPLRVRLWPGKIREPDIVFMLRQHDDRIGEEYWEPPDLVVEVISPRTAHSSGTEDSDRGEKFLEYAQAGVSEYWLVDPAGGTLEVYRLQRHAYRLAGRWGRGEVCRSEVMVGFAVAVDTVVGAGG
jgi:Uma2 family endonuclease